MSLLLEREPAGSIGLARFYLLFDLSVLAVIAVQMLALIRLARRDVARRFRVQATSRAGGFARYFAPLVWELGLPVAILALPGVLAMSWASLWLWIPDVAVVLVAVGTLSLATGALRVWKFTGAMRRGPVTATDRVPPTTALRRPVA